MIYCILLICIVPQSDPDTHTHVSFFTPNPLSCSVSSDSIQFPELNSRIPLLFHSQCRSVHRLTTNSQSILSPPPPPRQTHVCSSNLWIYVLWQVLTKSIIALRKSFVGKNWEKTCTPGD